MAGVFNAPQVPTTLVLDAHACQDTSIRFLVPAVHLSYSNADLTKSTVKEQDVAFVRMDIKDFKDNVNK